jgi:hypothetical protein
MSAARKPLTVAELVTRVVITVPEYAATFCADERTVRRAIKYGQIQALLIGGTWRIPVAPLLPQCGLTPPDMQGATPPSWPLAAVSTDQEEVRHVDGNPRPAI